MEFVEEIGEHEATFSFPEGGDYNIPVEQWKVAPIAGGQRTLQSESDYYIACFADAYEYRLYDDFGYDACLLIRNRGRFIDDIRCCTASVLRGWSFTADRVTYRDPYHPLRNNRVCFSKHFRYAYQQEFRFVWNPPTKIEKFDYLDINLSSLSEYCDLLIL